MISFFMAFIIFECLIIGYLAYILDSFGVRTARKKKTNNFTILCHFESYINHRKNSYLSISKCNMLYDAFVK